MIERVIDRAWRAVTSGWLLGAAGALVVALLSVSLMVDQVSLGGTAEPATLRSMLPGVVGAHDVVHSLVFLVAALGLAVALMLGAADRLLADRQFDLRLVAAVGARVALAAAVVLLLAQGFMFRGVTVPLGPEETALLPSLDATVRAPLTGWLPDEGLFGTLEVAPRLAGSELAGPFGDQDRPVDARLSPDAEQVELGGGSAATVHGLRLNLSAEPPAWAARVRIVSSGVAVTGPFLQTGQSWKVAAVPIEEPPLVAVDRVIPDFDPSVPITQQPLSGAASNPAAVVTVHQAGEVLGSRALAPGEQAVMGGVTVLLAGFAPALEVSVSRGGDWRPAAAAATAAAAVCAVVWGLAVLRDRRRRVPDGRGGEVDREASG